MTEKPKSTRLLQQLSGRPEPKFTGKRRGEVENLDFLVHQSLEHEAVQHTRPPGLNGEHPTGHAPLHQSARSGFSSSSTGSHKVCDKHAMNDALYVPDTGVLPTESVNAVQTRRRAVNPHDNRSQYAAGQVGNYSLRCARMSDNRDQVPARLLLQPLNAGVRMMQDQYFLQRLSAMPVHAGNRRDWSPEALQEFIAHLAPDAKFRFDNGDRLLTFDEQVEDWKLFVRTHPEYHTVIRDISCHFNPQQNEAVVLIECHIFGIEKVQMEAFVEMKWRQMDAMWLMYNFISMRSSSESTGFVFG